MITCEHGHQWHRTRCGNTTQSDCDADKRRAKGYFDEMMARDRQPDRHIAEVVADAPPLTPAQIEYLRPMFAPLFKAAAEQLAWEKKGATEAIRAAYRRAYPRGY